MTNREKFKSIFGVYAEEFWAYPKDKMLDWLQYDVPETNVGDMISRQAAIDTIDKYIGTFDAIDRNYLDGLKTAKKLMMQLPFAQQWIPVTERLPEYGEKVLVTFYNKDIGRRLIGISYCYVQKEGFFSDTPFDYAPVAWCELPEPWKGGEA